MLIWIGNDDCIDGSMIDSLIAFITHPGWQLGLLPGIAGLVLAAPLIVGQRKYDQIGWILALVGAVALIRTTGLGWGLSTVTASTLLGGHIAGRRSRVGGLVLALLGCTVLALAATDLAWWAVAPIPLLAVVGGWRAAYTEEEGGHNLMPLLVLISAFGIAIGVPEVSHPLALFSALLPLGVAALFIPKARLGWAGSMALVPLLVFTVAMSAPQTPGAVVGGWATFGLLGAGRLARRLPRPAIVLIHGAWVLYCSRIVGLRTSFEEAVALLVAGSVVGVILLMVYVRRPRVNSEA